MSASPTHRDPLGWSAPQDPPFIDTVTGIEYPSRKQLKKAVRVRLDKTPGVTTTSPSRRLRRAVENFARDNGIDLKQMAAEAIEQRISRVDIEGMVASVIEREVASYFGTRFTSATDKSAAMKRFIREKVHDHVEHIVRQAVVDSLEFDIKVRGNALSSQPSGRKVDLSHDNDIED